MVDYEKELGLDEEEAIEENTTPYMIDETLASLKYAYDINGLYIPFKSSEKPKTNDESTELATKWETVGKKRVHLQISRNNNKDCELQYQWVSKRRSKRKSEPYKALGKPVKRTTTLTDEDTNKTGATSLVGKLAKAGEEQGFELDIENYQTFITDVVKEVKTSTKLDVFKDESYILPSDDSTKDYDTSINIDMRDLVSYYGINGKVAGNKMIILYPFHDEHNPSAVVNDKGIYCSTCGRRFNYYDLIAEMDGLSDKAEIMKVARKHSK